MKTAYTVCVLGFNATEQLVLGSIFGLSARRNPKFVRHVEGAAEPDIYLVDADDVAAVTALVSRNAERRVPTILIGASDHGTGWPRLSRPLQWARLFVAFDISIRPRAPVLAVAASTPVTLARTADPMPGPADVGDLDPDATQVIPGRARALERLRHQTTAPMDAEGDPAGTDPGAPGPDRDCWVLVVDADEALREALHAKLRALRLNVACAASGEEAIGLTAQRHFACAFVGAGNSGLDGYQVCRAIKTRKGASPTVVVLLTDKASPVERIKGRMAGCDAHLAKPVDAGRLYELVARYLPAAAPA